MSEKAKLLPTGWNVKQTICWTALATATFAFTSLVISVAAAPLAGVGNMMLSAAAENAAKAEAAPPPAPAP